MVSYPEVQTAKHETAHLNGKVLKGSPVKTWGAFKRAFCARSFWPHPTGAKASRLAIPNLSSGPLFWLMRGCAAPNFAPPSCLSETYAGGAPHGILAAAVLRRSVDAVQAAMLCA